MDFNQSPFLVIWETTRACDLACVHCRASADPLPAPDELSHEEAVRLIHEVKDAGTPILIFSGGDALKRPDLPELITCAKGLGLRTGAIPAVTPLAAPERIAGLKKAGLDQIAFSLDAADAEVHDGFRRTAGVFQRTMECVQAAHDCGLPVQINSLVNVHNLERFDRLVELIETLGIVFWEIFFLVPVGRGSELDLMEGEGFEEAFERIYRLSLKAPFVIKITEAPHYRRFYLERQRARSKNTVQPGPARPEMPGFMRRKHGPGGSIGRAPAAVNAGKGFAFISCRGDVFPSGFLPLPAGNIRRQPFVSIYREAPLFRQLRDSSLLKGKCGLCPYREICGGSRSRAFAVTGDYLAEDPCCAYVPPGCRAFAP